MKIKKFISQILPDKQANYYINQICVIPTF